MNYSSEASIMVARQMKVVSQSDAFKITANRNGLSTHRQSELNKNPS